MRNRFDWLHRACRYIVPEGDAGGGVGVEAQVDVRDDDRSRNTSAGSSSSSPADPILSAWPNASASESDVRQAVDRQLRSSATETPTALTVVIDASTVVAALVDSGPDGRWAEQFLGSKVLVVPHTSRPMARSA